MSPKDTDKLFDKGVEFFESGDFEKAIKMFEKVIKKNPKDQQAWANRGAALANIGDFDEAIKCEVIALELNPQDSMAWFNKGVALNERGRYEEAIESLNKTLTLEPDFEEARDLQEKISEKLKVREAPKEAISEEEKPVEIEQKQEVVVEKEESPIEIKQPVQKPSKTIESSIKAEPQQEEIVEEVKVDKPEEKVVETFQQAEKPKVDPLVKVESTLETNPKDVYDYYNKGLAFLDSKEYKKLDKEWSKGGNFKDASAPEYEDYFMSNVAYSKKLNAVSTYSGGWLSFFVKK